MPALHGQTVPTNTGILKMPGIKNAPEEIHPMIRMLFSFLLAITCYPLFSQCTYFPADCPSDLQLPDSADRFGNPVVPAEVSMEIRLHDFLTELMQNESEKKGWEVYQYDESAGSGYLNAERSGPLAYPLRPPHNYEISFVIIVNMDSFRAWKEWNKAGSEKLIAQMSKMRTKDDFITIDKMQDSLKKETERFRNASMIRVKFEINNENAIASSITENIHRTAELNIPHAALAFRLHNDKTDERALFDMNQFTRCDDFSFILFGDWNTKPDAYQYYRPAYHADKKNTDLVTPKKISSDKVRTIVMHIEGSPFYMNQFLESFDSGKLNGLIVH